MFTGIIEDLGIVKGLVKENDNLHLTIQSVLDKEALENLKYSLEPFHTHTSPHDSFVLCLVWN